MMYHRFWADHRNEYPKFLVSYTCPPNEPGMPAFAAAAPTTAAPMFNRLARLVAQQQHRGHHAWSALAAPARPAGAASLPQQQQRMLHASRPVMASAASGSGGTPIGDEGQVTTELIQSMRSKIAAALETEQVQIDDIYGDGRHVSISGEGGSCGRCVGARGCTGTVEWVCTCTRTAAQRSVAWTLSACPSSLARSRVTCV